MTHHLRLCEAYERIDGERRSFGWYAKMGEQIVTPIVPTACDAVIAAEIPEGEFAEWE